MSSVPVRAIAAISATSMILAACSGGSSPCVSIADDAIEMFQDMVTAVDDLELGGSSESGRSLELPPMEDIDARAAVLQARAIDEGCGDEELTDLMSDRLVRLRARTVFGQALIESLRQEGLFGDDLGLVAE